MTYLCNEFLQYCSLFTDVFTLLTACC